jgi:dGTPase
MRRKKAELESFLMRELYEDYRVTRMTNKAKRFLCELFEEYTRDPDQLHPDDQQRIQQEIAGGVGPAKALYRVVCDYIAGMTDRFAQDEYKRMFVPFERV